MPESKQDTPEVEATPQPPNGVLIIREVDAEGRINVNAQPVGDVKITELPTLFKVALRVINQQLGVD